jgi:hypothetical protein
MSRLKRHRKHLKQYWMVPGPNSFGLLKGRKTVYKGSGNELAWAAIFGRCPKMAEHLSNGTVDQ